MFLIDKFSHQSFSNLWRFSGGATKIETFGYILPYLSVISGDSLVGQLFFMRFIRFVTCLSVISGDSLVGQQDLNLAEVRDILLSVISGDSLVGQPITPKPSPPWAFPFSNLWRFSGGATNFLQLPVKVLAQLSVISGDSLVGQQTNRERFNNYRRSFSNLWRFSGGATR